MRTKTLNGVEPIPSTSHNLEILMTRHVAQATRVTVITLAVLCSFRGFAANEKVADKPVATASAAAASPAKILTLSSAKTVRELIEMDDQIALSKERKALREEQGKAREGEPIATKEDPAAAAKRASEKAGLKRDMAAAASAIHVTAIMGVEGQRIVHAEVGGRSGNLIEGSSGQLNGWKLAFINGRCVGFARVIETALAIQKSPNKKGSSSANQAGNSAEQIACFVTPPLPTFVASGMPNGPGIPAGMPPRPVPVPVPLVLK